MKLEFIYWEASCNDAQRAEGEKYPHYALLVYSNGDSATVLYFNHKKEMFITAISKKETHYAVLAKVEVSYEIYDSVNKSIGANKTLRSFSDEFLSHVERLRCPIEEADDALMATTMSTGDRILTKKALRVAPQPFPRKL